MLNPNYTHTKPSLNNNHLATHGLMLLMVTLVASSFPVGAAITHALPPVVMMFLRFLTAALLFAPYVLYRNGLTLPSGKTLMGYALLSVPLVIFFWCMFEALRHTSALNTGALYTTLPAITALTSFFILGQALKLQRAVGLTMGTLGALWIVFRGDVNALFALTLNQGDLLFLLGCVALSIYNPLMKKLYQGEPQELMTFWVLTFGSLFLLLLSLNSLNEINWLAVPLKAYAGIGYLALFTTLTTFFLLQIGTVRLGPTKVAAYSYLTPLLVLVLTVSMGFEQLSWRLLPGAILVFFAMLIIQNDNS
ncbi:EamA family transporter [Agarivorans sp. B2Z047]|uniref:DMT family transporter n=1 Tax=Agarivorans sp. B2Z047 TaxID=2652721 RepID=UPI00128B96A3|nr:DMT family transporter [Agarivorans sp. B2Z047]MPW31761.1 EamA family transporter [Agarivorans sp. B2Z047]UQN44823.1 DMT family transporter [Agarivorans sp. B2Z047]